MAAAAAPLTCWAEGCAAPSTSACGRCRTAEYCGAPCQRAHWRTHKLRCKELEAAADAAEAAAGAAAAAPAAGAGGQLPGAAPRTPGVYTGLECRVQDYHCALGSCGATLEEGVSNTVCNGCRAVVYCDEECQGAHWAGHAEDCYKAVVARVFCCDVHQDDKGGEYVLRDKLRMCRDEHGAMDERTLVCISNLGTLMKLQGKHSESGALFRECLAARCALLGPKHKDSLDSMSSLALLLQAQGNLAGAVPLMREALDSARVTGHNCTLNFIGRLAGMLGAQGQLSEAEALLREALTGWLTAEGPLHHETLSLMGSLGSMLQAQGRPGGESLLRGALKGKRATLGSLHPSTLASIGNLGLLLQQEGELSKAEPLLREAMEALRTVLGAQHPNTLASMGNVALLLLDQGRLEEAGQLFCEVLASQRAALGSQHPDTFTSLINLGVHLGKQDKMREAEPLFSEALTGCWRVLGREHPCTKEAYTGLLRVLTAQGKVRDVRDVKAQYGGGK